MEEAFGSITAAEAINIMGSNDREITLYCERALNMDLPIAWNKPLGYTVMAQKDEDKFSNCAYPEEIR